MIDWNGDGKIDGEDWIMTEMLLDDFDQEDKGKPTGCCGPTAAMILLVLASPIAIAAAAIHLVIS